jgi:hypothetical protein
LRRPEPPENLRFQQAFRGGGVAPDGVRAWNATLERVDGGRPDML